MPHLSNATLPQLRPDVARPRYDRAAVKPGIVHIGLGAFARAHICDYTDEVLQRGPAPWGIVGINLRTTTLQSQLAPQNNLYATISRDATGARARIIGSLVDVIAGADATGQMLATLAAPEIRIVSLTVTEKGYCLDTSTGSLDTRHPDVVHDLSHPATPRSAVGLMCAALELRFAAGLAPFTVLSCDNIAGNGRVVGRLLQNFAALRSDKLAKWIERGVTSPSTMVDRIVPAMTPDDKATAATLLGLTDAAPVTHEPFRQWVIEDHFVDGSRPAWQDVGAEMVSDVAPFEHMKLRVLNAAHSALAYTGYLGGHETIGDCVADPLYRAYVRALWRQEILPVLSAPPGTDLTQYAEKLLDRFSNPSIRHRTWQIAMDGSQKLPPRLLATIRECLKQSRSFPRLALAVAAWIKYVRGVDEKGGEIDVRDPLAAQLREQLAAAGDTVPDQVRAALAFETIFGADLPANTAFVTAVTEAFAALQTAGMRGALARLA